MRSSARPLLLTIPLLLAACGSVPNKTFRFEAINVDEQPVECLVVVNDDWVAAREKKQLINVDKKYGPLTLTIPFDRSEIEVTVAGVAVNADTGKPERIPARRSESAVYIAEPRRLVLSDADTQLFILERSK